MDHQPVALSASQPTPRAPAIGASVQSPANALGISPIVAVPSIDNGIVTGYAAASPLNSTITSTVVPSTVTEDGVKLARGIISTV